MTEKRFRRVLGLIEDSNGDLLDLSEIADKMNQLNNENEELKQSNQEAIELIHDGIVEMHDSKRNYAEKLLNKAIELIK